MLIPLSVDARIPYRGNTLLASSCFAYDGPVRELIHSFKYSGRLEHAGYFARCLFERMDDPGGFDSIVTVPMQGGRLVGRGFDPSALIAESLARISGVVFMRGALARVRCVPPQVGLQRAEREKNVRGVFAADSRREGDIAGARILIVDDVMTSGATLGDCARALMEAGASDVRALTIARTL